MKKEWVKAVLPLMCCVISAGCGTSDTPDEIIVTPSDSGKASSEAATENILMESADNEPDGEAAVSEDAADEQEQNGSDQSGSEQSGSDQSGSDQSNSDKDYASGRMKSFEDILYTYKEVQDGNYSEDQVYSIGLYTELVQFGWPSSNLNDELRYQFYDIDSDGQDELIITFFGEIRDIYGYDKEKARLAFTTPYSGVSTLYPDGELELDSSIAVDQWNTTWYKFDSELGDYFSDFQELHHGDAGSEYYTFCYHDIDDQGRKEIYDCYRNFGDYPVWSGEWSDQITEDQYNSLIQKSQPVKLPEGKMISSVKLPADYESKLLAAEEKQAAEDNIKKSDDITILKDGESLKDLFLRVSGASEDKIVMFHQDDFDFDGKEEVFTMIADSIDGYGDNIIADGEVWFVSPKECKMLLKNGGMGINTQHIRMRQGKTDYVMFNEMYATGTLTYVWFVSDGRAVDAPFSKKGTVEYNPSDSGHFTITDSSYDAIYDPQIGDTLGHTWKHYYFYYDKTDDQIHEYGAIDISKETADGISHRDLVSELVPEGDKVESILFRDVCQVIINYSHEGDDGCIYYYHYIYNLARECLVDDDSMETGNEPMEGTVLKAMCPELAEYPEDPTGREF